MDYFRGNWRSLSRLIGTPALLGGVFFAVSSARAALASAMPPGVSIDELR